ncbi:MAG: hypothetical protein WD646_12390 [Actinomycetota bacterium]
MSERRRRSVFAPIGAAAAAVIVAASIFVRFTGPADPAADVAKQREAVDRFHELVRDERWAEVFEAMTEPPGRDASAFATLMRDQVRNQGKVLRISTKETRLLRSRTVPLLEVHESVTLSKEGRRSTHDVISYFAQRKQRWLFAFSARGDEG